MKTPTTNELLKMSYKEMGTLPGCIAHDVVYSLVREIKEYKKLVKLLKKRLITPP